MSEYDYDMRSERYTQAEADLIDWDDQYFKFCEFDNVEPKGSVVSDFANCTFTNLAWYWTIAVQCNFVQCTFIDCLFSGVSFTDTRFIDCKLTNCRFLQDNMGGFCTFDKVVAYGCTVVDSPGFLINARREPSKLQ